MYIVGLFPSKQAMSHQNALLRQKLSHSLNIFGATWSYL